MATLLTPLQSVQDVLAWLRTHGVTQLLVDSRQVSAAVAASSRPAFVAWPGAAHDGRAHVRAALQAGAVAALVEADGAQAFEFDDARVAAVPGLKATLAEIAHAFHGAPSEQLEVLAVTGTNGKTSTSWWLAQALTAVGRPCGVVGTLGVGRPGAADFRDTGLTTPDPVTLHATFRAFVDGGLVAAAIEASSIGVSERRLDATRISVALFTNFTQDHLDYHGTMEAYWAAKRALFEWPGLRAAVIHLDDARGIELAALVRARGLDVWTCAMHQPARLRACDARVVADGMVVQIVEHAPDTHEVIGRAEVAVPLLGEFNVANLLVVLGGLRSTGVPLDDAARACAALTPVPGRMQQVRLDGVPPLAQPLAVVDYAHTPDALLKALQALRPVTQARGGRLWCVFGCGGNRDAGKRPLMGQVAQAQADLVVLTSDNPRHEAPASILAQIRSGMDPQFPVTVIESRADAVQHALREAAAHDVVLIAGKGHEATQEVAGVKTPFSDVQEALQALHGRAQA